MRTQDVRDFAARLEEAAAGMAGKSGDFDENDAGLYLPVVDRQTAEAEETVAAD